MACFHKGKSLLQEKQILTPQGKEPLPLGREAKTKMVSCSPEIVYSHLMQNLLPILTVIAKIILYLFGYKSGPRFSKHC